MQRFLVFSLVAAHSWVGLAFTSTSITSIKTSTSTTSTPYIHRIGSNHDKPVTTTATTTAAASSSSLRTGTPLYAAPLRTNVEIPLLDLIDRSITKKENGKKKKNDNKNDDDDDDGTATGFIVPLPSSDLPDQLATPFLYGMQMDTPLHKMILEEAVSMAEATAMASPGPRTPSNIPRPFYGHLVWKDTTTTTTASGSDSLVGAIGCTAEILVNAPTQQILSGGSGTGTGTGSAMGGLIGNENDDNVSPAFNTVLCRGGWRFVVKEVVRSIPFPVAIVDEIRDDADEDDSDMFSMFASGNDSDDDDDDDDELRHMPTPELIHNTMRNVQSIIVQRLEEARAKTRLGPLEQSILEAAKKAKAEEGDGSASASGSAGGDALQLARIELAHAEEMSAVWEVFQSCLVDDIDHSQRRFAVATMAAELANLPNTLRREILLTRNSEERLRIVLRELNEIVGMERARKLAASITDEADESQKDLKVGTPQLPPWAKQIKKGTKVEYFWNEEWGWCPGTVVEDPVTIVDELLLTVRFDEDGEEHKLPLSGEDKVRWRPAS
eukprot:jgi/Psemu1/296102/fgenesh1_pm.124_\